jgi:A/G-specific adenine glycosylase
MAKSDEQAVLTLWQGLGYYRRAKFLKQTSEMITRDFGGQVPADVALLLKLPGVGRYTAGAIASIAFAKREPIVDGNVHRVLCRLENRSNTPAPCDWSWDFATKLVNGCTSPSLLNEGIMELGATICIPRNPDCSACPLSMECKAYKAKTQSTVPKPRRSPNRKRLHHYAVVLTCNGEIAFEKRDEHGLWAGMWQVPTCESTKKLKKVQVANELNIEGELSYSGTFEHMLTHRVISFSVFRCEVAKRERYSWYKSDELEVLPLASAQRKVLAVHCSE